MMAYILYLIFKATSRAKVQSGILLLMVSIELYGPCNGMLHVNILLVPNAE